MDRRRASRLRHRPRSASTTTATLELAKQLIDVAVAGRLRRGEVPEAHAGAVRRRREQRDHRCARRPWGLMTYLDYRHRIEFGDARVRARSTATAASAASRGSRRAGTSRRSTSSSSSTPPCYKVASASLTDDDAAAAAARDRAAADPLDRACRRWRRSTTRSSVLGTRRPADRARARAPTRARPRSSTCA